MTDKLRKTQPLNISFSDGEQPTAEKLTAVATQSRSGSAVLEKAIGDLWNQSGDSILTDNPNQIPNLARLLGENKYLNPALYYLTNDFEFDERLGERNSEEIVGYLNWAPKTGTTPAQVAGPTVFGVGSRKTNEYDVGDPNNGAPLSDEWYVSDSDGKFRVDSEFAATTILRYTVDPTTWETGQEVLPGVIPDPRQTDFTSCRVSTDTGNFLIHLPPRMPITFGALGTGHAGEESRPDKYPTSTEAGDANNRGTVAGPPFKYWQSSSIAALAHEHYRYHLPKEILDAHSSLASGAEYPSGFLYLYNATTKTVIEDVVFSKPVGSQSGNPWVIQVSSSEFDFSSVSTADETEASYNSSGLVLITCGGPVARSMWQAISRMLRHRHDNTGDQTAVMSHDDLDDQNPPTSSYTTNGHDARYPTDVPRWFGSRWEKDTHVSLLSRAGSQGESGARRRDPNDNAMLGDLVMASNADAGGGIYLDSTPTESRRIYFGSHSGVSVYVASPGGIPSFRVQQQGSSNELRIIPSESITLQGGSAFGTTLQGVAGGHIVLKISANDDSDSFSVFGDSTFSAGSTWDKLLLRVRNSGETFIDGNTGVKTTTQVTNLTSGLTVEGNIQLGQVEDFDADSGSGIGGTISGTSLAILDVDGAFVVSTQDGNGRVNMYWNAFATAGSAWEYIHENEPGARLQIIEDNNYGEFGFYTAPDSASSGDAVTWTKICTMDEEGVKGIHDGTMVQNVFAGTNSSDTISNTAALTAFAQSHTIPANTLVEGTTVRVRAHGTNVGSGAGGTVIFHLYFDGVSVANTSADAYAQNDDFVIDAVFNIQDVDTGTTHFVGQGTTIYWNSPTLTDIRHGSSQVSVDLATTTAVEVRAQMSVANVNNTVQLYGMTVDISN